MFWFPPPGNVGDGEKEQVRQQADHHREQVVGPETKIKIYIID